MAREIKRDDKNSLQIGDYLELSSKGQEYRGTGNIECRKFSSTQTKTGRMNWRNISQMRMHK